MESSPPYAYVGACAESPCQCNATAVYTGAYHKLVDIDNHRVVGKLAKVVQVMVVSPELHSLVDVAPCSVTRLMIVLVEFTEARHWPVDVCNEPSFNERPPQLWL